MTENDSLCLGSTVLTELDRLRAVVEERGERLAAIAQLASGLKDYLPGDAWHLAHAIEQVALSERTPDEALAQFED